MVKRHARLLIGSALVAFLIAALTPVARLWLKREMIRVYRDLDAFRPTFTSQPLASKDTDYDRSTDGWDAR